MFKPGDILQSTIHPDCVCQIIREAGSYAHNYVYKYHGMSKNLYAKSVDSQERIAVFGPKYWRVIASKQEKDEEYEKLLI